MPSIKYVFPLWKRNKERQKIMAYNKHQKLNDNIEAIRIALQLERENRQATLEELTALRKYSGFGGLKFILNPRNNPGEWKAGDKPFYEDTVRLFNLLADYGEKDGNFRDFEEMQASLKRSVTTAFYTPDAVIAAISKALSGSGIAVNKFLDPSSGNGKFIDAFKVDQPGMEVTAFEKDLLTGKILKALHPDDHVVVNGFETIPQEALGSFDLVTSNIPFGDIKVFDPAMQDSDIRKFASNTLHNYFFLKALDSVHDGGLVAFITSRGVMDSRSYTAVRMEMLRHANIVSAVRLPDGMFSEEAGTEAGSDLIILQKDMSKDFNVLKDADVRFINCEESSDDIHVNKFFLSDDNHIDLSHIIADAVVVGKNMYGDEAYEYQLNGDSLQVAKRLEEVLAADLSENLDVNLYNKNIYKVEQAKPQAAQQKKEHKPAAGPVQLDLFAMWDAEEEKKNASEPRSYQGSILPHWCDGVIIADGDQLGVLSGIKAGHPIFTPFTGNQLAQRDYPLMRQYVVVRDLYNNLYNTEAEEKVEQADLRKQLNESYDRFRQQYGALNERKIQRLLLLDPLSRDMLCVENVVDGEFVKADIFSRPVSFVTYEVEHVDTPEEALHLSMNRYGRINLGYMEDITGIGKDELIAVLKGQMYYQPDGHYQIAAKVLSGNIYEKIDEIESAIRERSSHPDETDQKYDVVGKLEETKAALVSVIPTQIAFDDIGLQFGERWISTEYYKEYISKLFDTDIEIHYAEHIDEYSIKADNRYNLKIREEYCIHGEYKDYDGMALLQHAFHDTTPDIQKCVGYNDKGEDVKAPDMEKIQLANSKIQEIRNGFAEYLTNLPKEQRDELQEMYNRKFNCFVKAKYDGDYQTFPGIDLKALAAPKFNIKNIYKSQKDCVSMIVQNGGGICDHEVGTGKTLIMCMAAHEMHRLGTANKPMIIALKANVSEIAATYRAAFPDDKILYASEKDFSPANRVQFFNRIKNNDYACVIMSHDQFCKIPQPMEIQEQILSDEIRDLDEALEVLKQEGHSISKRMLTGLEKRKENLSVKLRHMQYVMSQRTDDVVDFGTMGIDHILVDESHQFKNLMFTTRHQRVSGLGNPAGSQKATNLLYAIRTIQQRTGRDLGATFLSGTTISNSLTELYLLFKYLRPQAMAQQGIHSFDAWAAVYAKKTTDYEFNVTNQIASKERYRYFVKVPELATFYNEITDYRTGEDVGLDRPAMNVILHNIAPTADQQDFNQRLVEFAKSGDGELIFREPLSDGEEKGKMLIATDASRKAALDMRLVSQELFGDDPDNKSSHCAKLVAEYYQKFNEQKGTQFIFSDLSTYKPGEWNVFSEIKRKLVEDYGIPENEIRFIQEAKNENQRKQMIQDMNDGKIRVLFGSTSTLGTGVNAQNRAVAVHHIDIPWRPSDLEQRNGRARRTGNWLAKEFAGNKVDIIVYAVERSLDSYKFNLLQNKQLFITQLKTNQLGSRVIDEGSMDEQNGMNFGEYVAILSGNDDLLQKEKLKNKVMALESERKTYMMARRDTEWRLGNAREKLEKNDVIIRQMTEDYDSFQSLVKRGEDGTALPGLVLSKEPEFTADGSYNIEGMGSVLQDAGRTVGNKERQLGTVYGFPLLVDSIYMWDEKAKKDVYVGNRFYVQGHYMYEYNNGKIAMSKENRLAAVRYGVNALEKIPGYIKQYEERNESLSKDIADYERIAGKAWPKEQELLDLKQQMEELEKKIQASLDETKDSMPKQEEPVYNIVREGRNHKVTFNRDKLPLVSLSEMREAADTHNWRERGYVHCGTWCGSQMVSTTEVEGNFSTRQKAEEWIKGLLDLQKSRVADKQWLEAKAAEDTDGYMIHQDNEVIFAARKCLAELNGEDYHLQLPADVRQQLFEHANKTDYHSDRYSNEKTQATEARKTLYDYGIDWRTNLSLDAVKQYIEKWSAVELEDLRSHVNVAVGRFENIDMSIFSQDEIDFLRVLEDRTSKRFLNNEDRKEALVRLGVYLDYLGDAAVLRSSNDEKQTVDSEHTAPLSSTSLKDSEHQDTQDQEDAEKTSRDAFLELNYNAAYAGGLREKQGSLDDAQQHRYSLLLRRAWFDNDDEAQDLISREFNLDWRFGVSNDIAAHCENDFDDISDEAYLLTANNVVLQKIRGMFDYQQRNAISDPQFELLEWYFDHAPEKIKSNDITFCSDFLLYIHVLRTQYGFGESQQLQEMINQSSIEQQSDNGQEPKVQQPKDNSLHRPFATQKEARDFLAGIGYAGKVSRLYNVEGKSFIKYFANGVVTPNIYIGETTPMDVYRQFHLYGNIMEVQIPEDVRQVLEKEQDDTLQAKQDYWEMEREKVRYELTKQGIPFYDVVDCERGCRIVFTENKNENGNYTDWYDVSDSDAIGDDMELSHIRELSEKYAADKSAKFEVQVSESETNDINSGLSSIVEQRHLDTDEVFIQNHSESERQSLRYREGERYEDYLQRNNLTGSENDAKLYFHDKYTSSQWQEVNDLFAQMVDKDSAVTVGRKVADLSFVESLKEGQALFDLQQSIKTETILPYLDGLHEIMNSREESPMMKQFHDLKAKHPDAMLLFRCGDFYETYEQDANTAAKVLGITLTWRRGSSADFETFKGAMAGFPHHALDTYLPKLIRAGLRVAICDQLEAPKKTVKRGITELVSPGVKMQVVDRISSLLPAEKALMSQIVMDLETGNHLLGRPRSKEYWDFAAEHGGAVRALKEGVKLTDRQRDILLERAYNYHGGIAELAAMLNMNEQQLRKALIYDAVQEHRIEQNFHVFEDGLFYVEARHGYGLSSDFVEQVAQVHYGERTKRDGRMMYRFPSRDDASNFVHNIGILNERYTNVLRDGLIEKMRKAGIDVNTDWQEGERVLQQQNASLREQRVVESSVELSTVLAGEITRHDVERAMDSRLVKSWLKAKNSNDFATLQGFNLFGSGMMLVHEFAKARLDLGVCEGKGS